MFSTVAEVRLIWTSSVEENVKLLVDDSELSVHTSVRFLLYHFDYLIHISSTQPRYRMNILVWDFH